MIRRLLRRLAYAGAGIFVMWLLFDRPPPPVSDDLSTLEPEMCSTTLTSLLTATVPMTVGSPTRDLRIEQIALIDQFKPDHRRKLWVLRLPSAYVMQRTCDLGAQNWVGEDDSLQVSQLYGLGLILSDDHAVAVTRATDGERQRGIPVFLQLTNGVVDPDRLHQSYALSYSYIGLSCAERPSAILGLITFKRVNADEESSMDCEGIMHTTSVFARKVNERTYDVLIQCLVRCVMHGDYEGWAMTYLFDREHLEQWQTIHDQVTRFVAEHTFHLDRDL
jgi:hypothetical protein